MVIFLTFKNLIRIFDKPCSVLARFGDMFKISLSSPLSFLLASSFAFCVAWNKWGERNTRNMCIKEKPKNIFHYHFLFFDFLFASHVYCKHMRINGEKKTFISYCNNRVLLFYSFERETSYYSRNKCSFSFIFSQKNIDKQQNNNNLFIDIGSRWKILFSLFPPLLNIFRCL